MEVEDRW